MREKMTPEDFGIKLGMREFTDDMVNEFNTFFRGQETIDDALLNPRAAMNFCDFVRHKLGNFTLTDDFILRSILNRRKNPCG